MSSALEQIMERYSRDPAFKAQLQADPEGAARATGIALDDDRITLRDEQLRARVGKRARYH